MPSGNIPLHEAVKYGDEQALGTGLVQTIIQEGALIPRMNWKSFEGEALVSEREGNLPTVSFRNVNEGYTADWASDTKDTWGVAILGGEVKVDKFLENVVANRTSLMKRQLMKKAKANSMRFDYEVLNGTGSVASKGFKGLKSLVTEGFGQLNGSAVGAQLTLFGDDSLTESMDLFLNQGGPDEMWINRSLRTFVTHLAHSAYSGFSLIDIGTDSFGRKVTSFNGVPMVILGKVMDSSGNIVDALPFTEDPGDAGNDTTSIWMVKHGEDDFTGIAGRGGTFQAQTWGELESGPYYQARFEWYPGIAVLSPYSVVRHQGILAPDYTP